MNPSWAWEYFSPTPQKLFSDTDCREKKTFLLEGGEGFPEEKIDQTSPSVSDYTTPPWGRAFFVVLVLSLVVQTRVLSGHFRLSPRKIARDGRRPLPWTARRSEVLFPVWAGQGLSHWSWEGPEVTLLEWWSRGPCETLRMWLGLRALPPPPHPNSGLSWSGPRGT